MNELGFFYYLVLLCSIWNLISISRESKQGSKISKLDRLFGFSSAYWIVQTIYLFFTL